MGGGFTSTCFFWGGGVPYLKVALLEPFWGLGQVGRGATDSICLSRPQILLIGALGWAFGRAQAPPPSLVEPVRNITARQELQAQRTNVRTPISVLVDHAYLQPSSGVGSVILTRLTRQKHGSTRHSTTSHSQRPKLQGSIPFPFSPTILHMFNLHQRNPTQMIQHLQLRRLQTHHRVRPKGAEARCFPALQRFASARKTRRKPNTEVDF